MCFDQQQRENLNGSFSQWIASHNFPLSRHSFETATQVNFEDHNMRELASLRLYTLD